MFACITATASDLHCTAALSVYSQNANVAWEQLKYRVPLNDNYG